MNTLLICLIGVATVVSGILVLRLHAFLALILAAFVVAILTPLSNLTEYVSFAQANDISVDDSIVGQSASKRVAAGFGLGCQKVAIVIALAAVIGQCLLLSGAARRIVEFIGAIFGAKKAPLAFLSSGFVLGIPVFFDTVFFLLFPIVRSFAAKNGRYLLAVLSVVAGASMAHSLIPPTPGPLTVSEEMGVNLGMMFLVGIPLGIITISCGYLYAKWAEKKWDIPIRKLKGDFHHSDADDRKLPPILFALMPILVPLVLISTQSILKVLEIDLDWFSVISDKNVAMALGAAFAMWLAILYKPKDQDFKEIVQSALSGGGVIILITAAGSAFGATLAQTNIAEFLASRVPEQGSLLLVVAFVLTALVRFAQGSATVAMLTSIGIIAPWAAGIETGFHPVYIAMAIGCGSKPLSWMNDSGFWIVSRMSGMTETETLKTFSVMLTVMGTAGFVAVLVASKILPLV